MMQMSIHQIVRLQETPVVLVLDGFVTNRALRVGIPMLLGRNAPNVNWEDTRLLQDNCQKGLVWRALLASTRAPMSHNLLAQNAPKDMHCKEMLKILVVCVIRVG
jgi:hypothetical protein